MGGILGGSGDGLKGQVADILIDVFDRYDIEPGELNENINKTVQIVQDLKPIAEEMQELSGDLEGNVGDLRDEVQEFNNNSTELAKSIDEMAESLDNFNQLIEEAVDEKDE